LLHKPLAQCKIFIRSGLAVKGHGDHSILLKTRLQQQLNNHFMNLVSKIGSIIIASLQLISCSSSSPIDVTKEIWADSTTNNLIRYAIQNNKENNTHKDYLYVDKAILWFSLDELREVINRNPGFTMDDTAFMRKQLHYDRKFEFKIDTSDFRKIEFISLDSMKNWGFGGPKNEDFWQIYREKVHRCFCLIYCPIYNRDKSLAIMSTVNYCGSKWIEGYDILYKRIGHNWIIVDTTFTDGS
jgi:hypothetical protein